MFSYIRGALTDKTEDYAVLDVGGVGFKIFTNTLSLPAHNRETTLYTHMHIREDAMCLYGFMSREELNTFEMLVSVSKVGPKVGLAMLSALSPSEFALAVVTNNPKALARARGVGLKLAQRIILELKDKLKHVNFDADGFDSDDALSALDDSSEAVKALMVLGYSQAEAVKATAGLVGGIEDIIKQALAILLKH